jgi:hypothetical protein
VLKKEKFECSAVLNWCEIELTNFCWLDCFWCVRKELNQFWYINFTILKKIINFIKSKNYTEIVLSGLWDIFLNKELYKFIDYIFENFPDINIYIMTKWQSISKKDIDKILLYKKNNFNLNLTFSVFSLNTKEYENITWWGDLKKLIKIIKYSYIKKINFSFEFLLNKNNILGIKKYIYFTKLFQKEFIYSIPHNWWGSLVKDIYNKLYNYDILKNITTKRKKWEICEAFIWDYLFFDYLWNIYKCGLKRFDNSLLLWNINTIESEKDFKKIDYKNCINCSYYKLKTKVKL